MSNSRDENSQHKEPLGNFFLGLFLAVVLTGVWQLLVWIAVVLIASSHFLALHTRYRGQVAGIVWLMGFALNGWSLYRATRRYRPRTVNGILAGIGVILLLSLLLGWVALLLKDYPGGDE